MLILMVPGMPKRDENPRGLWIPGVASCQCLADQSYQGFSSLCSQPLLSSLKLLLPGALPFATPHYPILQMRTLRLREVASSGCVTSPLYKEQGLRCLVPSEVLVLEAAGGSGPVCLPINRAPQDLQAELFPEPERWGRGRSSRCFCLTPGRF